MYVWYRTYKSLKLIEKYEKYYVIQLKLKEKLGNWLSNSCRKDRNDSNDPQVVFNQYKMIVGGYFYFL